MSAVVKPIKKAVKWVGNALGDVVSFAADEIIKPVADAIGGVLEGMADDPITTIATIAAAVTQQYWAIPLIAGASTAAHGGDIKDVAISMAASYVSQQVGTYVGDAVGSQVGSSVAGNITSQVAAGATRGAVSAAIRGEDIGKGALSGAISGGISAGMSELTDMVSESAFEYEDDFPTYQSAEASVSSELSSIVKGWEALPKTVQDVVKSGAAATITQLATTGEVNPDAIAGVMANAAITSGVVAETLKANPNVTDQQALLYTQVLGNVIGAAYSGADPYAAYQSAMNSFGQKELEKVFDEVTGGGLDRVVDMLTGAWADYDAAQKAAGEAASAVDSSAKQTNAKIAEAGRMRDALDPVLKLEGKVQKAAGEVETYGTQYKGLKIRSDALYREYQLAHDIYLERFNQWNSGHDYGSKEARDAAKNLIFEAEKSATALSAELVAVEEEATKVLKFREDKKIELRRYESAHTKKIAEIETTYGYNINAIVAKYNSTQDDATKLYNNHQNLVTKYNTASTAVEEAKTALFTNEKHLDDAIRPVEKLATETVVRVLRPDFNADQYKTRYNLGADDDPFKHWLETGRVNHVNDNEYNNYVTGAIQQAVDDSKLLFQTEAIKWSSTADYNDINKGIVDSIRGKLGDNLAKEMIASGVPPEQAVKIENQLAFLQDPENVNAYAQAYLDTLPDISLGYAPAGGEIVDVDWVETARNVGGVYTDKPFLLDGKKKKEASYFSPRYNREVLRVYNPKDGMVSVYDLSLDVDWVETAPSVSIGEGAVTVPLGDGKKLGPPLDTYKYVDPHPGERSTGGIEIRELPPLPPTLSDMVKINPVAAINAAGKLEFNKGEYEKLGWFGRTLVDTARNLNAGVDYLTKNKVKIKEEYGIDIGDPDTLRKNAGLALGAGGELLSAFNSLTTFFRNSRNNPIDARTTDLGKATQAMIGIATAVQPEDYNNLVTEWRESFQKAEGVIGTLSALWDGLAGGKYTEVILREVLGKEILQEIPLLIASGGVGTGIKWGAKGALALGKKAGAELAAEITEQIAKKWGSRAAWSTNAGLQVLETAGATAGETFAETYDELRKVGYTHEAASARAQEYAITNGVIAAAIEGTIGRVLNPSDKLVSSIVGGKRVRYALNNLGKKAAGVVGEGGSELIEEVTSSFFKIQALKEINPDSDMFKPGGRYHDLSGVLTANGIIGAFAGTGTASSVTAAGSIYNALSGGASKPSAPTNPDGSPRTIGTSKYQDTGSIISNGLINFNPTVNQAVNDARSDDPVVSTAGETKIKELLGYDSAAAFDGVTIDLTKDPDGAYVYNTTVDILNNAQPDNYTTTGEATAAFDTNTALIPYVPTATEIQSFVGSKPQATLQTNIDAFIDRNYTDAGEVAAYFEQFGYTPTQAEIDQNVGQGLETETASAIDEYRGPRQTTSDEVLEYFKSLGYDATDAEAALFAGQGGADFQTTQLATIDPYVDPRQTTRAEVEQFFKDQNYPASEEEIKRFVAQANDPTFQATQEQELITEFDPLAVTSEEVSQVYKDVGFPDAIIPDVERFTGQYAESELAGKVQDYIPIATYNSIAEMLGKPGQEVTQNDIDFVTDIIAQREVMSEPTPFTENQLQYDVNNDNVIDLADKIMLEQIMAGTVAQTQVAPTSQFAATGIQGQMQQQMQQQTQMQTQIQQQIQAQEEAARRKVAEGKRQQGEQYLAQLMQSTPVEVKTPDPAKIEYVYDPFGDSIFATPAQEALYVGPYAQKKAAAAGGIVSVLGGRHG
jgi:hypothetical protein